MWGKAEKSILLLDHVVYVFVVAQEKLHLVKRKFTTLEELFIKYVLCTYLRKNIKPSDFQSFSDALCPIRNDISDSGVRINWLPRDRGFEPEKALFVPHVRDTN